MKEIINLYIRNVNDGKFSKINPPEPFNEKSALGTQFVALKDHFLTWIVYNNSYPDDSEQVTA